MLTKLKALAFPVLAALVIGAWLGWMFGAARVESHYKGELHAQAVAYATAWQKELREFEGRSKRALDRAVRNHGVRQSQELQKNEVMDEVSNDPDWRDCGWRDAHRLRIDKLYRVYGLDSAPSADRLRDR